MWLNGATPPFHVDFLKGRLAASTVQAGGFVDRIVLSAWGLQKPGLGLERSPKPGSEIEHVRDWTRVQNLRKCPKAQWWFLLHRKLSRPHTCTCSRILSGDLFYT